nr:NBS-LRR disease resistance protein [Dasypyrum villosum]
MAMVLDAFATYVQNMLTEMVKEEVHMLLGVREKIDKMDVKLGDLKNFLADADRKNITDKRVQEWVSQLKRAMYEAADILDLCQLKAMEHGPSTVDVGCFNPLLFCMRNPSHAHDIGTRIKALNKKLDTIKERSAAFSFINLESYEDRNSQVHISRSGNTSRETSGEFDRSGLVGEKIEEDTRKLVEIMLAEKEGNTNIMVVSIVGVGGIGKTTLAQKVFNDEALNAEFEKMIWLSINKDLDKVELLRTIITQAGGVHGGEKALAVLHPILAATLKGKKLFLVLDDVWNHGAWDDVLKTPLSNVVVEMVSSETDGREIDMLKDIGLQILAKCDGLPLAVKVMGGLLCQKEKNHRAWQMVLDDSIWSLSEMPEELNHAVYLSYEDLPSCIKQCFLYYSLLPKTALFPIDNIIGMWISEGFIHGTSADLEELGSKYYKELILRNLIEPDVKYVNQCVCKMHDVVRSFAQFKFLRLSLDNKASESDVLEWSSLQTQSTLRTLISVGHINMKHGDSLVHFPCLRTLHIDSAHVAPLVESLHEFKHLRYLSLEKVDISSLPDSIGKMKFLQCINLAGCKHFVELPRSILHLGQLRYLNFNGTSINGIPRGFHVLTNLRVLSGFPARMDGDWCSLEELGPLSRLKFLQVEGLENVTAFSSASKAKLGEKVHLMELSLHCGNSILGDDGLIKEEVGVSEEGQQQIEKVFDELCPPPRLEYLSINAYFGRRLPRWMMSSSVVPLNSLRNLLIDDLACCTLLPDGLCQLPYLEFIQIRRAPAIKYIGPEFMRSYHHHCPHPNQVVAAFPRLHEMNLLGMVEWEEWEWEEQVQAFPILQQLVLKHCKLKCLPPGLSSQAKDLNKLFIYYVENLISVDNFPSLVELEVAENLDLERITNLPRLQKLTIEDCPELKVLVGVPALQRLVLDDNNMERLPEFMGGINPLHFDLECNLMLLTSIALGQSGPEWDKFSHVEHVNAYTCEGWYVSYTANPYNLETNVIHSVVPGGTLSYFEDAQRFESVFKMTSKTFIYICSLVKVPSWEDTDSYTFVDGRVLSLEDQVAVALIRLYSTEAQETLGSSLGVNESTVLLVTERFVAAVYKRGIHHVHWPDSSKMDKIKYMFGNIHNMHNCCGVIHTTNVPFGPNYDHGKTQNIIMQFFIDPKMRFWNIHLTSAGSMDRLSILQNSKFFKECEKGAHLNGSKLKAALDGPEVGEYIIGDEGYPLLPWLITPYQEEDLSSKAEFNRRHSSATSCALKALARFKGTWRCLQGETRWPDNLDTLEMMLGACCLLHNIVIDMEDDAAMPSIKRGITVRKCAIGPVDSEYDDEGTSSVSGAEKKEREAQTRTSEEEMID